MKRVDVLFIIACLMPSSADGTIIQIILYRTFTRFFRQLTCQNALLSAGENFAGCECDIRNRIFGSDTGEFNCEMEVAQCLVDSSLFCVDGDYEGNINFGFLGIFPTATGCYKLDSGPPPELSSFGKFEELCITTNPGLGGINDCSVTIGGEDCQSCEPCQSGDGITFNCANVDIGGTSVAVFVPGPVVSDCTSLGLAPL